MTSSNIYRVVELSRENLKKEFEKDLEVDKFLSQRDLLKELFEYAIVYNYDSVLVDKLKNIEIDMENLIETRMFNKEKEIRFRCEDGKIEGVIVVEEGDLPNEAFIEKDYFLYRRENQSEASKLKTREYIECDEDGQAYIGYVRPVELMFGGNN